MLTGKGITKAFDETRVLHGVEICVAPGAITALIGPSGSGKTTLLRALSMLDPPDSGRIVLDDVEYEFPCERGAKPKKPWPQVTMVFQQFFLWPHLTLRENIALPLKNTSQPDPEHVLEELAHKFEIEDLIDRHPNEVSLGQRQRAALVRALVLDPKYLLLDEITSALDVEHISKVLEHLKVVRDRGTGILLVTHLIGFAKHAADQIAFMENGEIIERGGPEILGSSKSERMATFVSLVDSAR